MKYILIVLTLLVSLNAKDTIVNVPLTVIKNENKLPKEKVLQEYKNVKFYISENKDNTFSIFYKSSKDKNLLKTLKFNFKGANYFYELNQSVDYALTTLMERCDGINRKGLIESSKKMVS